MTYKPTAERILAAIKSVKFMSETTSRILSSSFGGSVSILELLVNHRTKNSQWDGDDELDLKYLAEKTIADAYALRDEIELGVF